jgi:hypothetical protein
VWEGSKNEGKQCAPQKKVVYSARGCTRERTIDCHAQFSFRQPHESYKTPQEQYADKACDTCTEKSTHLADYLMKRREPKEAEAEMA